MNNSTASLFLHSVLSGGKCEAECVITAPTEK